MYIPIITTEPPIAGSMLGGRKDCQNFSKLSDVCILHSNCSSKLTFENIYLGTAFENSVCTFCWPMSTNIVAWCVYKYTEKYRYIHIDYK